MTDVTPTPGSPASTTSKPKNAALKWLGIVGTLLVMSTAGVIVQYAAKDIGKSDPSVAERLGRLADVMANKLPIEIDEFTTLLNVYVGENEYEPTIRATLNYEYEIDGVMARDLTESEKEEMSQSFKSKAMEFACYNELWHELFERDVQMIQLYFDSDEHVITGFNIVKLDCDDILSAAGRAS